MDSTWNISTSMYVPGPGTVMSHFGLTIKKRGKKALVIISELPTNRGASVTNAIERAATIIFRDWFYSTDLKPEDVFWVEHYIRNGEPDSFDLVCMVFEKGEFMIPTWTPLRARDLVEAEQMLLEV